MKITVTVPNDYSEAKYKTFTEGVQYLKKLGHNVTVDAPAKKGKTAANIEKLIRETDIVLTETSSADLKVGFDLARALNEKKIVIALEKAGSSNQDFGYVVNSKYKNMIVKSYDAKNIKDVIDQAVEEAKKMMDTKFILIISPEIDRYLDWASQTKRMHKAQIVRNAVETMIKKDKDYKNYID